MKCAKCATENNYYHKYCYNCGAKLPQETEFVEEAEETFSSDEPTPVVFGGRDHVFYRRQAQHRQQVLQWLLLALIIVLVGVAVLLFVLFGKSAGFLSEDNLSGMLSALCPGMPPPDAL